MGRKTWEEVRLRKSKKCFRKPQERKNTTEFKERKLKAKKKIYEKVISFNFLSHCFYFRRRRAWKFMALLTKKALSLNLWHNLIFGNLISCHLVGALMLPQTSMANRNFWRLLRWTRWQFYFIWEKFTGGPGGGLRWSWERNWKRKKWIICKHDFEWLWKVILIKGRS